MKTKEQKVNAYYSMEHARKGMESHIEYGWYIHTCVSFCDGVEDGILVVYERELESWN